MNKRCRERDIQSEIHRYREKETVRVRKIDTKMQRQRKRSKEK